MSHMASDRDYDFYLVGAAFYDGWHEELLDFGEGVEVGLHSIEHRRPERPTLREDVMTFMRDALSGGDADLFDRSANLGLMLAVEGSSRRRTLERILERFESGPSDPEVLDEYAATAISERFPNPFHGRFLDEETANNAATIVVRQHESALRDWDARSQPLDRLIMRGDTGRVIGELFPHDGGDPLPSTYVTVLMAKTQEGKPYIRGAYPDLTPDPLVIEAYPELPQLFAAFFGQDWTDNDRTLWNAEHIFHMGVEEPQAQRIRDQLDALIAATGSQEEMRHALTSLGSAVLPQAARQWVQRIRGRMDPSIWHPEHPDA